ncbi:MAG: hypothetical protein Kow00120_14030 [Anaerolineae bacterium]
MRYQPVDAQTAQALADAAAQCRRAMRAAGLNISDDLSPATVANLEALIASYPEGHIPNAESVFQFVAVLGETVRAVYGGYWAGAEIAGERELGVVTGGPHGDIFWNVTAKLRRRLQARAAPKREALTFYWETIAAQMRQP